MHSIITKPRRRLRGLTALLFILVSTLILGPLGAASAETFPDGYPKMGHSSESVKGHSVVLAGYKGPASTSLFPVYTAPGSTPNQFAYCIEMTVSAKYDSNLSVGGWDSFPGSNKFRTDKKVREAVAWIVYNSYPNRSLAELEAVSGLSGLTTKDAIAATQAAIWSLTDAGALTKVNGVDKATETRVKALFAYLTGDANVGRAEVLEPTLDVQAVGAHGRVGTRVGPIVIESTEDFISLTTDSPYPLVDADGNAVDLARVPGTTELFIDVPSDAKPGSAGISVELTGSRYTGLLVTNITKKTHYQTLMISSSDEVKVSATATASWEAVPALSTHASDNADGDKQLAPTGEVTVLDEVTYSGLIPGTEYSIKGELMVREGAEAVSTGILASRSFIPAEESGTVDLTFTVPADTLNGATIVVYERLYQGTELVAEHTDILDEAQTVYRGKVEEPPAPPVTEEPTPEPSTPQEPTPEPTEPAEPPTPTEEPEPTPTVEVHDSASAKPTPTHGELAKTGFGGLAAGAAGVLLVAGGITLVALRRRKS